MAHHVPPNPCLEVRQCRPLRLRFLNSVLSQVGNACRNGLSDGLRRDTLSHCHKRDRFGRATAAPTRSPDQQPHTLHPLGDSLHGRSIGQRSPSDAVAIY